MTDSILIVDDDDVAREDIIRALAREDLGLNLDEAEDGLEALDYLDGQIAAGVPLPRLVILDLRMPNMDGLTVLEELENRALLDQQFRQMRVIAISGCLDSAAASACRSFSSVVAIVRKFAAAEVVIPMVKQLLVEVTAE